MKNKWYLSLCVILFSSFNLLYAQSNFKGGYVIIQPGDTVHGEIELRGDKSMGHICTFRSGSEIKEYTPNEIIAYRLDNGKYFISKEVDNQHVFLEFLMSGRLNIYYNQDNSGKHYYIENENLGLKEIPYKEEEVYGEDGTTYLSRSRTHLKVLGTYMNDCPEIHTDLRKLKSFDHGSLINIAQKYHNLVCKDDVCIIYKQKRTVRVALEAAGGITVFRQEMINDDLTKNTYPQGGVLAHLWLPAEGDNLYLKTGLAFSSLKYKNGDNDILLKVPIYLVYLFHKDTFIRPKLGVGINIYKPFFASIGPMGGVNIKLKKSIYWSLTYDIDFEAEFPPQKLFSQSFSTGLYIVL